MSRKTKYSLAAALVLVAVVAAVAVRGGPSGSPRAEASSLPPIKQIAARVERVRGLRFHAIPKVEEISAKDLASKLQSQGQLKGKARRQAEKKGLAAQGVAALSGIIRQQDLEQQQSGSGGGGTDVGGVYLPTTKRLYIVREAVAKSPALAEVVIAHELTHALEDQHFHDFEREESRPFAETATAAQALIEGSATLTELRYAQRYLHASGDLEALLAKRAEELTSGPGSPALKMATAFPYTAGGRFVDALHSRGGWKLVDFAHRHPPRTTEAILHPAGWHGTDSQRKPRFAITKPPAGGWKQLGSADVGEFDTRELLRVGLDEADADRGAAGWDAGSFETWVSPDADLAKCKLPCRDKLAAVIAWRWDTPKDAKEFVALMRRSLAARTLGGKPDGADGFALDGGAAALQSYAGRRAALAFAPTLAQARRLLRDAENG